VNTVRSAAPLLCLALSACASIPSQEPSEVRTIIERHNSDAARWYALGEIDSIASMFAEDAWQMPPNSPPLVGREAIRQFWRQAVKWGRWEFSLRTQDVSVSGPLAIERGKYLLKFVAGPGAPPGMASFEDQGNYLVHWRREADGEWRAVGDAPVSEVPRLPPPAR
jgi:ketosteroid isomerase-like protein